MNHRNPSRTLGAMAAAVVIALAVASCATSKAAREAGAGSSVRMDGPENDRPSEREPFEAGPADILDKAADYCEKLRRAVLYFVCREQVEEWVLTGQAAVSPRSAKADFYGYAERKQAQRTRTRANLLYDYQLKKDKEAVSEQRTLLMENGKKKEETNAPLKTRRFYSTKAVYGPIGFLSREWRDQYDFSLLKEEKIEGRKAVVIMARPKAMIEGKPNFGKIWVDREDFSILRIDIEQESLPGFEAAAEKARQDDFKPVFTVSHVYGVKKNGLRFPSRTAFHETYKKLFRTINFDRASEVTLSSTVIEYRDYRFFTVDVDVDYRISRFQ